jgi:hypothetical protein
VLFWAITYHGGQCPRVKSSLLRANIRLIDISMDYLNVHLVCQYKFHQPISRLAVGGGHGLPQRDLHSDSFKGGIPASNKKILKIPSKGELNDFFPYIF